MTPPRRDRFSSLIKLPRTAVAIGLAVFLVVAGTGTASALWTAASLTATGSVSAGTLTFGHSGGDALAMQYRSDAVTVFAPVTVKNSGTVPSTFSLQVTAVNANNLARAITVASWLVPSAADCTATPPSGASTASARLDPGVTMTGASLDAGFSAIYCVRTVVDQATTSAASSDPAQIRVVLSAAIGNWTYSSTTTVASQSVVTPGDTTAPTAPANLAENSTRSTQTTLTWSASSDAVGVTGYRVYRAGVAIATVTGLSYTNTGLTGDLYYPFTVRAYDAAGNESADSNSIVVHTPPSNNRITNLTTGFCIEAENAGTTNFTKLILATCADKPNQSWQFGTVADGFIKVSPSYATNMAWDIDGTDGNQYKDGTVAKLWTYLDVLNEQWKVQPEAGGTVRFVNRDSGKCLDVPNANAVLGVQLQQYTCNGTGAQSWSLTTLN